MKRQVLTALLVAATASGVAFAQGAKKEGKKGGGAKAVTVRMHAQNKSGETGTARLTPVGDDKTRVEVSLKGAPSGTPQPAHIHEGSCAKLNPKPKYGLENVTDGKSTTEVPVSLKDLESGQYAINVHKSADDLKTYVSCGDIGKRGMGKKSGKMEKKS
jgi:Cu/Zn superoxide dismutase